MSNHRQYSIEPWLVREAELDLDRLAQAESVFALANGHIGLRGNLDEGEPHGLLGTYLNGFHERRPLPYAERGYGNPEAGQSVVNVTDGKVIRLLVDDEPFDLRYGTLERHERVLDLRAGLLHRLVEWRAPTGQRVRVRSTRMVSFVRRAVAAISWEVEALDGPARVVLRSELVANEPGPTPRGDPRVAAALEAPLVPEEDSHHESLLMLIHHTRASELRVAAGADHIVEGPDGSDARSDSTENLATLTVAKDLKEGQKLCLTKFLAYGWSAHRSLPALRGQVGAALAEARNTGWKGLLAEQREYLDDFWARADVEIEGDAELQQSVRFSLYHVLQAGARGEQRAIPGKGLTGTGYDGHAFWDSETFVLPVLTYTAPDAVADALRWRHSTLDLARNRAEELGERGAAFPWRTIAGEECSAYWPAGTAAFHVSADVADAVVRYQHACDDEDFARDIGLELLVETARLWRSLGHHDALGNFRIDGITGPDEYTAIVDNNVYTNLMAKRNLIAAADAVAKFPEQAAELSTDLEEAASWRDAAEDMVIPYHEESGIHPQSEGFLDHEPWDFDSTPAEHYPLLLNYPYFALYRSQVVKQADLVLALHLCGDSFTAEEKLRNFEYYEGITVRDSSLSACTQSVVAAEVGHLDLALAYLREAARMDLDDLAHNTEDGLHIAALAGAWLGCAAGFGGLRDFGGELTFAPRLPDPISAMTFRVMWRGTRLKVDVTHEEATYTILDGPGLTIKHHGEEIELEEGSPTTCKVPHRRSRPPVAQPPHRQPRHV